MTDLTTTGPHFIELMETLLAGHAICEYRYPELHRVLAEGAQDCEDEESDFHSDRVKAEAILRTMGRTLGRTESVYYAVYYEYDDTVDAAVRARFTRYTQNARLLCEFFDILRECSPGQVWPIPGDRFAFARVLDAVVASTRLHEKLMALASTVTSSRDPSSDVALRSVVNDLAKNGYITTLDKQDQSYVLTGEIALFNQWRDFVAELEDIDLETESEVANPLDDQGSLL